MTPDRRLRDRRSFPAMNIPASSRAERMLLAPDLTRQVTLLRKMLSAASQIVRTELLVQRLAGTNDQFCRVASAHV